MNNPHIENAIHTIGEANIPGLGWETADAQHIALQIEANTRATLALAYAQDTANLIAYQVNVEASYPPGESRSNNAATLNRTIQERLNLA